MCPYRHRWWRDCVHLLDWMRLCLFIRISFYPSIFGIRWMPAWFVSVFLSRFRLWHYRMTANDAIIQVSLMKITISSCDLFRCTLKDFLPARRSQVMLNSIECKYGCVSACECGVLSVHHRSFLTPSTSYSHPSKYHYAWMGQTIEYKYTTTCR